MTSEHPTQIISELWHQTSNLIRSQVRSPIIHEVQENIRNQFWDELVPGIRGIIRERLLVWTAHPFSEDTSDFVMGEYRDGKTILKAVPRKPFNREKWESSLGLDGLASELDGLRFLRNWGAVR